VLIDFIDPNRIFKLQTGELTDFSIV